MRVRWEAWTDGAGGAVAPGGAEGLGFGAAFSFNESSLEASVGGEELRRDEAIVERVPALVHEERVGD